MEAEAVSSDGTHVWVTDDLGNVVVEFNASTGAVVQVVSGPSFEFRFPEGISSDGTHVWVSNLAGASVTELSASTGALVEFLQGGIYSALDDPIGIDSDGTNVWVTSSLSNEVIGLPAG